MQAGSKRSRDFTKATHAAFAVASLIYHMHVQCSLGPLSADTTWSATLPCKRGAFFSCPKIPAVMQIAAMQFLHHAFRNCDSIIHPDPRARHLPAAETCWPHRNVLVARDEETPA